MPKCKIIKLLVNIETALAVSYRLKCLRDYTLCPTNMHLNVNDSEITLLHYTSIPTHAVAVALNYLKVER